VAGSDEIAQAAKTTPSTIRRWSKQGLLPPGTKVYRGRRGTGHVFPDTAVAQAVWVKAQLDAGRTVADVKLALQRGEFTPPKAEP